MRISKWIADSSSFAFLVIIFLFCSTGANAQQPKVLSGPEAITTGYEFTEGPYWHSQGYLLFSDIPANTIYMYRDGMDKGEVYIKPSGHSNGITADNSGNLILAQHDGMVSKVVDDKTMKTLVSSYKGKRLNSPNDVVVSSDGVIYFTDPPFGVSEEDRELDFSGVFKVGEDGTPELLYKGFSRPNGIVLSPDETILYVNDSASGRIIAFGLIDDGSVGEPKEFAEVGKGDKTGAADGMVVDTKGNLYSTGPGPALYIFDSSGNRLNKIGFNEQVTNVAWGGPGNKALFVTGANSIFRLKMNIAGVKR